MPNFKDADGNELHYMEKIIAAAILLFFTGSSAYLILGLWPDRIPVPTEKVQTYYQFELFNVKLVKITDEKADRLGNLQILKAIRCGYNCKPDTIKFTNTRPKNSSGLAKSKTKEEKRLDSLQAFAATKAGNSLEIDEAKKALAKAQLLEIKEWEKHLIDSVNKAKGYAKLISDKYIFDRLIHLNTLQLILVALAGFLGNMVYIGASFTAFLGSGQFKRSWLLWYIVKPVQ